MQQHTGQHLLSAVFEELHHAKTVSFHLGAEVSTIDVAVASLSSAQFAAAEHRANEIVFENRPVAIDYEDAADAAGLRKASERSGTLRIVSIEQMDRSACGGTHVRRTGEIGPILLRKSEKIRGNVRVEFLAGMRAVTRAHADYDALSRIAQSFSAALDETPALVAANASRLADLEKARRKLAGELATLRGTQLYSETQPDGSGFRRFTHRGPITDELRMEAQGFTRNSRSLFLAVCPDPPSLLLAASSDSGINAGALLKQLLDECGGRGGGSATIAQGSVPTSAALEALVSKLPLSL
jgi:alanyl-tRNA synthetase